MIVSRHLSEARKFGFPHEAHERQEFPKTWAQELNEQTVSKWSIHTLILIVFGVRFGGLLRG